MRISPGGGMVYAAVSKTASRKAVRVRLPPWVLMNYRRMLPTDKNALSYIIGVALGDGNLSNPNGRAVRLRITCDLKYPHLITKIQNSLQNLFPLNKVSIVKNPVGQNYINISCYSNYWEEILGWNAKLGSKMAQKVSIPTWIKENNNYKILCLRGLLETDGSIYFDRGYKTVMIVSAIPTLAIQIHEMILSLGYPARIYKIEKKHLIYRIRLSKHVDGFLELIKPEKF